MNVVLRFVLASVLVAVASPVPGEDSRDTFVYEKVGGWTVYTDRARDFDCFMEARFQGGSVIHIDPAGPDAGLRFMIGDPAWPALESETVHVAGMRFDESPTWELTATARSLPGRQDTTTLDFVIDSTRREAFRDRLMRARQLAVSPAGHATVTLSLAGSFAAAQTLDECLRAMPPAAG